MSDRATAAPPRRRARLRPAWLIARSVLIEAVRRREIYAIVLVSTLLIGAVMTVDFFKVEGLVKFYREVALKVMSLATSLTVIVLAARQLPREFEARTIYPLLAKPVSRAGFLCGKLLGVMLAGAFCFAIFMAIYLAGSLYLGGRVPWSLFLQYLYLQMLSLLILATLSFWLSMLFNLDAAVSMGFIFFASSSVLISAITILYEYATGFGKLVLLAACFGLPQLSLLDLGPRTIHDEVWAPLDLATMLELTAYAGFFAGLYFALALLVFRRKPL